MGETIRILIADDHATVREGLSCIGRLWQRSRGSAFIGGVGIDAEFIAGHVIRYLW